MKLSEYQAQALFMVLGDTLPLVGGPFKLDQKQRLRMYNEILDQMDGTPVELEPKGEKPE